MNQLSTRLANPDDLPLLSGIWYDKAVLLAQQDARLQLAPHARAAWEHVVAAWLDDAEVAVVVVEDAGTPCGYIVGRVQVLPGMLHDRLGAVVDLSLDLHDYHPGAGRALVEALRLWFNQHGIDQMIVQVHRQSAIEQAFWRSLGSSRWMEWLWIQS
ncbi:MAG: hypothetical protein IT320_01260 [Anaerolineae bacterium]|nr:hypothetical protein [Anaerolineae bacterium]